MRKCQGMGIKGGITTHIIPRDLLVSFMNSIEFSEFILVTL